MLADIFLTATAFGAFYGLDTLLTVARLEGIYYIVHAIHNAIIVAITAPEVITTLTAFSTITNYTKNMLAIDLCAAIQFYHISKYWRKFSINDWLHHGLMVGFALPIGVLLESHTLMGFSLFFTIGLPGCIGYACLALVRNGKLERLTERRINNFLNVWISSPGCIAHAILSLVFLCESTLTGWTFVIALIPAIRNYWHGQYFMCQVVRDFAIQTK